jgi:unsaturated chondroitin disaccharide hydrolase
MDLEDVMNRAIRKIKGLIPVLEERIPDHAYHDGIYRYRRADWWTSGFYPGILWILYDLTRDESFRHAAWHRDEELEPWLLHPEGEMNHDVGFQFLPSAVMKYKLTGHQEARRRGLAAACYLLSRFNSAGSFIRAWNSGPNGESAAGWAIIDCMMNIPLLFWASRETGDPRFQHAAVRHANTVLRYGIRQDGSASHILSFDPESGEFIESLAGQGFAADSAWSRGAAWALYGYALAFRYSGDPRYLAASKQSAHFFISSLPEDVIPYWDFRLPDIEGEPRDSSAAAIAASGLLELAELVPPEEGHMYTEAAKKLLQALTSSCADLDHPDVQPILTGATGNRPMGHHVDCSLIFGDYFYIEALAKLNGWKHRIF